MKNHTQSALAAKAIKQELKKAFPAIKFSVVSDNFSMGNSVNINYTNGVPVKEVEAITRKYQYGHFDGMNDTYENSNSIEGLPQAKYVSVSRKASSEINEAIKSEIPGCENLSMNDYHPESGDYVAQLVYRIFVTRTY